MKSEYTDNSIYNRKHQRRKSQKFAEQLDEWDRYKQELKDSGLSEDSEEYHRLMREKAKELDF